MAWRSRDFDLCLVALPSAYRDFLGAAAAFEGYELVTQVIDTSGGWEGVKSKMARAKRNLVNGFDRKYGLESGYSTAIEDLEHFYQHMFVPYVTARFGKLAVVDSLAEIKGVFQGGGMLIYIMKDGKPVAASLCVRKDDCLSFSRVGVLDGAEELLKCGVLAAVYYFQIKYAIENGLSKVDTQQSRPFLTDGVYDNKARWGAVASPYAGNGTSVSYIFPSASARIVEVFHVCPVIVNHGSNLMVVIGYSEKANPTDAELKAELGTYYLAGIDRAVVLTPAGQRQIDLSTSAQGENG